MSKKAFDSDEDTRALAAKTGFQVGKIHQTRPPDRSKSVSLDALLEASVEAKEGMQELPLTVLKVVPERKRHLTAEQFQELKENLSSNPLTHPIIVRPPVKGMHEVVAGHNRIQAFLELGRTTIPAIIMAMDDDRANLSAFYSNLLAPSLPDYEKFKGFQFLAARFKKTQQAMAKEAGMSKSSMSKIFAFEKLPVAVLELLDATPNKDLLGSEAASKLAILSEEGRGKRVVEAVQKLVAGEVGQGGAVAYASQAEIPKPARPEPIDISFGKQKKWCSVIRTAKDVRLSFAKEESVDEQLVADLITFLKARTKNSE